MYFADLDARFFQGVIPAALATCSNGNEPNLTYASHVTRVDARHIALSCQFFNKTKQNLLENPYATLLLYDPVHFDCYRLSVRYDRSETEGPVFNQMAARVHAIASHTGMVGTFRLLAAEVCEVLDCELQNTFSAPSDPSELAPQAPVSGYRTELRVLQTISQCLRGTQPISDVLRETLENLDTALGFAHTLIYAASSAGDTLELVAAHGYDGVQATREIRFGDGLIGTVAQVRRLLRLSSLEAELRYGRAIRRTTHRTRGASALQQEVALPGLFDARSQMAIPLLAGEKLIGVIAVEDSRPLAFDEWDEAFLEILASQFASRLNPETSRSEAPAAIAVTLPAPAEPAEPRKVLQFRFFSAADCVFLGDDYLVRNVPGRILWRLLRTFAESGRADFSNRELRLDPWLGLPAIRDNLESRLTLLRKRLEERCPELRLVPTARGCFRMESQCAIELEEVSSKLP